MSLLTIWKPLFQPKIYDKFDTEKFHDFFFFLKGSVIPTKSLTIHNPVLIWILF